MDGERLLFCLRPEEEALAGQAPGSDFKEELLKREEALLQRLKELEAKLKSRN